ncbi:30S ribosomal protein S12 methylthiotransferase RimO [Halanaerobiaceae bacterium Z-7014]|uniref:Ribosomal protein uS12 methylthiotransferase RimO n=1 Tax=Halonatronomonas betaini TaxID=2778430 RepID=A0A931F8F8_9FIRM|nr:30S ribosomal protein S12 methylthiotransferase RimO [Halonatronomonas betaini]MBF8437681.1 30S ribosomal protein S12 methylthiotransferase RimO [Halonatronomonas betaini]
MSVRVFIYNLGCPKNQVDGEYIAGYLTESENITLVDDYEVADIIAVNTCGFIETAKEESIEAIFEAVKLKETGNCQKVIVTGCLAQRYVDDIKSDIPEVDGIFGIGDYQKMVELVEEVKRGQRVTMVSEPEQGLNRDIPRVHKEKGTAYLKIADGCDQNCTYCTIPSIKGGFKSREMEYILNEARRLVEQGINELILVAQDTALYGLDIYGEVRLAGLLEELAKIDGLKWIRLMYTYPEHLEEKVLEVMAREDKICNYLDIPIQHAAGQVRKRMGRPGDRSSLEAKIARIRNVLPDVVLRTSLIVGFPGESEEEFEELVDFIKEVKFDRLGVFTYSKEENTPAARLDGQLDEDLKVRRYNQIMEEQQTIALEKNSERVDKKLEIIVEEIDGNRFNGRTEYDAPEIDNAISGELPEEFEIEIGSIYLALVKSAFEYDLEGEIIDEIG